MDKIVYEKAIEVKRKFEKAREHLNQATPFEYQLRVLLEQDKRDCDNIIAECDKIINKVGNKNDYDYLENIIKVLDKYRLRT